MKYFWNSSMRLPFSIKWIFLVERRFFDQKHKFSYKNDMVSAWRNFKKKNSRPHFTIIFRPEILNFTNIPFWPGKQWSDSSYTVCLKFLLILMIQVNELTNICLQVKWYLFQHQVICKCSACIPGHIALLHPPVDNLVSSATKLSLQSTSFVNQNI